MSEANATRKALRALTISSSIALMAVFGGVVSYAQTPAAGVSQAAQMPQGEPRNADAATRKPVTPAATGPFVYDQLGATPSIRLPGASKRATDARVDKAEQVATKTPAAATR